MYNENQKEKIRRFLGDVVLKDTVHGIMLQSFLKTREGDIHIKAASRLAIDFLNEAWKELEKFKNEENENKEPTMNHV